MKYKLVKTFTKRDISDPAMEYHANKIKNNNPINNTNNNYQQAWKVLQEYLKELKNYYKLEQKMYKNFNYRYSTDDECKMEILNDIIAILNDFERMYINSKRQKNLLKHSRRTIKFKGWSYNELANYFGITVKNENETICAIISYLKQNDITETANALRKFIKELYNKSKNIDYYYPLWKGLLKIKDNGTLINSTIALLETMWT